MKWSETGFASRPVSPGDATITVTATDPDMLTAQIAIQVLVPNRPPELRAEMPPARMEPSDVVRLDLSEHFADPDGEELTYSAESSDAMVASAAVSADMLAVTGEAAGSATVTVTATDPGGLTATGTMEITVRVNRPPVVVEALQPVQLGPDEKARWVLSLHFSDPDGDALAYDATSSDRAVASADLSGDTLVVEGESEGSATVTVTATDPGGLSATAPLEVTVRVNLAPVAVKEIPAARINPDETVRVVLSEYFVDPDGPDDELVYDAASSDPTLATVAVSADTLAITGVSAGEANLTVTATDPGGLSATAPVKVVVRVNRPPVVVEAMQRVVLLTDQMVRRELGRHFDDPDGEELVYEATSSDTLIASVAVSTVDTLPFTLTVTSLSVGDATVTVTATDPGGLGATLEWDVAVVDHVLPFRDDFDSDASLDNWELQEGTTAGIDNGAMSVSITEPGGWGQLGLVRRPFWARDWTATVRLGNVTEGSWAQMALLFSSPSRLPVDGLALQVGEDPKNHWRLIEDKDANWRLLGDFGGEWKVITAGISEAVGGVSELVDVTLSHVGLEVRLEIGDSLVFRSTDFGNGDSYAVSHLTLAVWPVPDATETKTGIFDWVEFDGEELEPDAAHRFGLSLLESRKRGWLLHHSWSRRAVGPRDTEAALGPPGRGGTGAVTPSRHEMLRRERITLSGRVP